MMDWLTWIHGAKMTTGQPGSTDLAPGDDVRVWYRIIEQGKERLGQFEGTVIRCRGGGPSRTFTVRRVSQGEGVERVFPVNASIISRVERLRQGRVKRARLYFLRRVIGKVRIASNDTLGSAKPPEGVVAAAQEPAAGSDPHA